MWKYTAPAAKPWRIESLWLATEEPISNYNYVEKILFFALMCFFVKCTIGDLARAFRHFYPDEVPQTLGNDQDEPHEVEQIEPETDTDTDGLINHILTPEFIWEQHVLPFLAWMMDLYARFLTRYVIVINSLGQFQDLNNNQVCQSVAIISGSQSEPKSNSEVSSVETETLETEGPSKKRPAVPETPKMLSKLSKKIHTSGSSKSTVSNKAVSTAKRTSDLRTWFAKKQLVGSSTSSTNVVDLDSESSLLGNDFEMVSDSIDCMEIVQKEDCIPVTEMLNQKISSGNSPDVQKPRLGLFMF